MKVKIEVTDDDIRLAKKTDFSKKRKTQWCPIARALRRVVGDHPSVATNYAEFTKRGTVFVARLFPKKTNRFIRAFDVGKAVKPFSFTVDFKET